MTSMIWVKQAFSEVVARTDAARELPSRCALGPWMSMPGGRPCSLDRNSVRQSTICNRSRSQRWRHVLLHGPSHFPTLIFRPVRTGLSTMEPNSFQRSNLVHDAVRMARPSCQTAPTRRRDGVGHRESHLSESESRCQCVLTIMRQHQETFVCEDVHKQRVSAAAAGRCEGIVIH